MSDVRLVPGSKAKVRGEYFDFTDHLDGHIVTVLQIMDTEAIVRDENGFTWAVYVNNLTPEEVSI